MRTWTHRLILAAIALLAVETFLVMGAVTPVVVAGPSMAPTLQPGRRVWVLRALLAPTTRGAVVVLRPPSDLTALTVKRVLGLPGERVELLPLDPAALGPARCNIDGAPLDWPHPLALRPGDLRQCRLGPDEYFLVGDNTERSTDSRNWPTPGAPARLLLGRIPLP